MYLCLNKNMADIKRKLMACIIYDPNSVMGKPHERGRLSALKTALADYCIINQVNNGSCCVISNNISRAGVINRTNIGHIHQ